MRDRTLLAVLCTVAAICVMVVVLLTGHEIGLEGVVDSCRDHGAWVGKIGADRIRITCEIAGEGA
jgi:hypothetical protein